MKAESQIIDALELWCWRRLLRVPWTTRRSNQSILKEISPGCSLEGLMLKVKLQYFGHLMWRADSLEKTPMLGEEKGVTENEMVGWLHWLSGHECEQTQGDSKGQGSQACCSSWGRKELDMTERLNWTEQRKDSSNVSLTFPHTSALLYFRWLVLSSSPCCSRLEDLLYQVRSGLETNAPDCCEWRSTGYNLH